MIEEVTEKNWQKLAQEMFHLKSLVKFHDFDDIYAKVGKITNSGNIIIILDELEELKRKDDGAYMTITYDPSSFKPKPYLEHKTMTFTAVDYEDKQLWQGPNVVGYPILEYIDVNKPVQSKNLI